MEATSFQPDLGKDGCQTADFLFPISVEENLPNLSHVNSGEKLRGFAHFHMAKMNFYKIPLLRKGMELVDLALRCSFDIPVFYGA